MGMIDNLRSRLLMRLGVKTTTLDGVRVSTDPGCPVMRPLRSHMFKGQYEAPERAMIQALICPDDRVLDIGACVGVTAALCAQKVGPDKVLAYEANPALESAIRTTFALNGMAPDLRMRAVTADGRAVSLHIGQNVFSSSTTDRGNSRKTRVESDAIGDVLGSFHPTMILLDVEGAEEEIISATDFAGVRKIVLETHPHIIGDDRSASVLSRIAALGFTQAYRHGISYAFQR